MRDAFKTSRFLFLVSRPYSRRFLLPFALILLLAAVAMQTTQSPPAYNCGFVFLFLFFISMRMGTYPFYAGDRVPQVFAVLPQRRADLVRGVYLNFLLLLAGDLLLGLAARLALRLAGVNDAGFLFVLGSLCVSVSLTVGIELPILFRVGFARIQIFFNLFYMAVGFLPVILVKTFHWENALLWLLTHRAQLDHPPYFGGLLLAALLLLAVSYRVSLTVYRKKDL